jgi:hypothetical protein
VKPTSINNKTSSKEDAVKGMEINYFEEILMIG